MGRKTSKKERIEIAQFCLNHNKDYGLTMEMYKISYQQAWSYTRKYEEKGISGLVDRRGRPKKGE